jgi:putative membrane protein
MSMTSNLGRRVFKHGFVFTTALLTCAALQADHNDQHGDKNQQFIRKAAMGGHMEVEMGQLAQQKGQSSEVKNLGSTLVRDHTQANQKLEQLASSKNITLDKSWSDSARSDKTSTDRTLTSTDRSAEHGKEHASHHQELDRLRSQSGAEFDKAFVKMAIKDHKKDITEFEKCRNDVTDTEIKAFIDQTLPTLRNHLQMARTAAKSVGVDEATIAADRDDDNASSTGAPAAGATGTLGSDRPSSPASNPNTNPGSRDRSSLNGSGTAAGSSGTLGSDKPSSPASNPNTNPANKNRSSFNGTTDTDASGTIHQNNPRADIDANVGDRSVSASADVDKSDSSASVNVDSEKKNKVFQKGDGKVLGLSTDKSDGKFLGIIPDPKKKHEDKGVNAEVNVNTDSSSVGTSATTESGTSTRRDSDQK